jgi:hypothetical protein
MPNLNNPVLLTGAGLSIIAGLLHITIIVGGPAWYRFFHAGARIVESAVRGSWYAPTVTLAVTVALLGAAAYAMSAAGTLPPLPLLKVVIVTTTAVFLARGLVLFVVLAFLPRRTTPFLVWSSLICLGYGMVHLLGVVQVWRRL